MPNDDRGGADVRAEGLGKPCQERWRQRLADHSANTGNADLESWDSSHGYSRLWVSLHEMLFRDWKTTAFSFTPNFSQVFRWP